LFGRKQDLKLVWAYITEIFIGMPKTIVPVRFVPDSGTGYVMDIGTDIAANGRFVLPPDVPQTEISTILTNIGAQPLSAVGDPIPCSDASNADLRKLEFIRSNGNSMSVPVSSRANLLNAATVIRGVLNSAGADVVCIKLIGEYFPDLADELGLNYGNDFAVSHVPTTGGKQYYHAGNISYETDATSGVAGSSVVFQPVKAISDLETAASSQLSAAWTGCVGPFVDALACRGKGRRNPRKHRRYLMTFAVGSATARQTETTELPVKDAEAASILSCGQAAAALNGLYCIGYQGESYARYHKLLP
jgi:hypothetical protein